MSTIKRVSFITLWVYVALVPASFLIPRDPELGTISVATTDDGFHVFGEIEFERGGIVNILVYQRPLARGVADFERTIVGSTHSSDETLVEVVSGSIPHSPIRWQVNWDAVVLAYVPIWLAVGLLYWMVTRRKRSDESPRCSEQGVGPDAGHAAK